MADSAVGLVIDRLVLLLTEEVKLLGGIHGEIVDIKNELESIQSFLRDADPILEQEDADNGLATWVKQVREVAYRIEDVVDEYIFYMAPSQDQHGFFHKMAHSVKKLRPRREIASKISDLKNSVREMKARADRYSLNSSEQGGARRHAWDNAWQWHDPRVASLYIEEAELVGIESLRNELVSNMVEGPCKNMVISVVGMGGLGKTTLAKKVYDDQRVAAHFDCHAWITVSQVCQTDKLIKKLLRQFHPSKKKNPLEGIDPMEESLLISKIREYLKEKRYIVVFDDVWNTEFWGYMKYAFPDNEKGSRIIITTRNEDVAPSSKESSFYIVHKLQPLPQDKALELFCKKVFQSDGGYCPPELSKLSHVIVERCEGLPLAIVTIGGLLATKEKSVSEWQKLCNGLGSALASNQRLRSITRILSLSYHDLPYYLKPCFLYFGMFPEDYSIRRSVLIRLWIAEGFIKERQGFTLEEVAEEYLTELVLRNLVQVAMVGLTGKAKKCRVHDLMHEIILSRSGEFSFHQISVENCTNVKGMGRHIAIQGRAHNITSRSSTTNSQTRSIILFEVRDLPKSLISSTFESFKLLNVLHFDGASLIHIPNELGNLLQLKYLSLRYTSVKSLPKSIGKLINLETLDLRQSMVYELPIEINRLLKLRHLVALFINYSEDDNPNSVRGVKIHGSIGSLKALQKLRYIEANSSPVMIKDFESLTQLRKLGITKLKREHGLALCTALEKMIHLRSLSISSIGKEEFLELQSISCPPPLLQRIYLDGPLAELPSWVSKLDNLVKIHLNWSRLRDDALQELQALPNLLELQFHGGYNGENLHFLKGSFQKVKVLTLRDLAELKKLTVDEGALPFLEELVIGAFPQLKELPSGIHFLKNLKTLRCYDMQREFTLDMLPEGQDYWKVKHIPIVLFLYKNTGLRYNTYKLGDAELLTVLE